MNRDDELEFHLEMQTRRYMAAGLDREAARVRALARLGDLDDIRRECASVAHQTEVAVRSSAWWQGLGQDLRAAWRAARKAPLFTATVLVTIATGIGASTAIFSVVNAVLLQSVAYQRADQLGIIWNSYGQVGLSEAAVAAAEFADFRERQHTFEQLAAVRNQNTSLGGECAGGGVCEPERAVSYVVSPSLFTLLAVSPALGRAFTEADGAAGARPVTILSDALWRRRFGADPAIIGRTIVIGATRTEVAGVMPPGVRFPDAPVGFLKMPADLWVPYDWTRNRTDGRGNQNLAVVVRLRADVTMARAQADLDGIADGFRREFPNRYAQPGTNWRIKIVPLREQMVGDTRLSFVLLGSAVAVVLLIACANVANLMLARGSARRRELALRSALGASRRRIVRQLLVETMLYAATGGLAGVLLAVVGVRGLVGLDPGTIPFLDRTGIDLTVLGVAAAVTLLTGLLIGIGPALRDSMADPQATLAEAGRGAGTLPLRRRLRGALVVAEIALAVLVLVAAGLLVRSYAALTATPIGFDPSQTAVAQVSLPRARYDVRARVTAFYDDLTGRLAALPGVTTASGISNLPMSGEGWSGTLIIRGRPRGAGEPDAHAEYAAALPGYFHTMRIPMREGRDFGPGDIEGSGLVAVVDETLAARYWPGESAIGKHLAPFGPPKDDTGWSTVIGVVGHVRNDGPRKESEPQVYLAARQSPQWSMSYVVRTGGAATAAPVLASLRSAVRDVDRDLAIARLLPTPEIVARVLAPDRFNLTLITIFGGVALLLAVVGLYGVMAFVVSQRTREVGIRLALGGQPRQVVRHLLGEGLRLATAGIALGLAAALVISRALSGLLFGITAADPLTYVAIGVLLLAVALAASYLPARRALRIDPVKVLAEP